MLFVHVLISWLTLSIGHQSFDRKTDVRVTYLDSLTITHLCSAHPGTNLGRLRDLYLVKCLPPWKNAALRQLPSIVSLVNEHLSILLIPLFSGLVVSEPAILKIFNVGGQKLF